MSGFKIGANRAEFNPGIQKTAETPPSAQITPTVPPPAKPTYTRESISSSSEPLPELPDSRAIANRIEQSNPSQIEHLGEEIAAMDARPSRLGAFKDAVKEFFHRVTPAEAAAHNQTMLNTLNDKTQPLTERFQALEQISTKFDPDIRKNAFKSMLNQNRSQIEADHKQNQSLVAEFQASALNTATEIHAQFKRENPEFGTHFSALQDMQNQRNAIYADLKQAVVSGKESDIKRLNHKLNQLNTQMSEFIKETPTGNDEDSAKMVNAFKSQQLFLLDISDRHNKLDMMLSKDIKHVSVAAKYFGSEAFETVNTPIMKTAVDKTIHDFLSISPNLKDNILEATSHLTLYGTQNFEIRAQVLHQLFQQGYANPNTFTSFLAFPAGQLDIENIKDALVPLLQTEHVQNSSTYQQNFQTHLEAPLKKLQDDAHKVEIITHLQQAHLNLDPIKTKDNIDILKLNALKAVLSGSENICGLIPATADRKAYISELNGLGLNGDLLLGANKEPSITYLNPFLTAIATGDMDAIRNGQYMHLDAHKDRVEGLIALAEAVRAEKSFPSQGLFPLYQEITQSADKEGLKAKVLSEKSSIDFEGLKTNGKLDYEKTQKLNDAILNENPAALGEDAALTGLYHSLTQTYASNPAELRTWIATLHRSEEDVHACFLKPDTPEGKQLYALSPAFALMEKDPDFKAFYEFGKTIQSSGIRSGLKDVNVENELDNLSKSFFDAYRALKEKNIEKALKRQEAEQILSTVGWSHADVIQHDPNDPNTKDLFKTKSFFHDFILKDLGLE